MGTMVDLVGYPDHAGGQLGSDEEPIAVALLDRARLDRARRGPVVGVCRRSGIKPPSLYARVDGTAGLFAAVYDRRMTEVQATEYFLFDQLPRADTSLAEQATAAADGIAEVLRNARSLPPARDLRTEYDPKLLERGAAGSRRLLARVSNAITIDAAVGDEIARTHYAECILRTIYGATFFTGEAELEPSSAHASAGRPSREWQIPPASDPVQGAPTPISFALRYYFDACSRRATHPGVVSERLSRGWPGMLTLASSHAMEDTPCGLKGPTARPVRHAANGIP